MISFDFDYLDEFDEEENIQRAVMAAEALRDCIKDEEALAFFEGRETDDK